jgi:hypothetical protein
LPIVAAQIERGQFSLQELARRLGSTVLRPPRPMRPLLRNVNTPKDWARLVATRSRDALPRKVKSGNSSRPAA